MGIIILIILGIILLFILYKVLRPYFIKYDHILFITGQIGSGKTLTTVKEATTLLRRARFSHWWQYKVKAKIINNLRQKYNKKALAYNNKLHDKIAEAPENKKPKLENKFKNLKEFILIPPRPQIYSNIPLLFKQHFWTRKKNREWACKLLKEHLYLTKEMAQNSVVIIDELPQLVNQFNWDEKEVQTYINEFITFFRHYYNGYILMTAQATNDVVAQIRRKGNKATWCMNFKTHLFGLFYSCEMCDIVLSDDMMSISTAVLDENTRKYYSLFPPKDTYDSRCYSDRIQNMYEKLNKKQARWEKLKTNEIMRIKEYESPLDDTTSTQTKQAIYNKATAKKGKKENGKDK